MNETETDSGAARARRALPMTLVVLASVIAFLSVFAIWAKRQLLETDTWTHTSSRLLENEDIRNAVADFLVTQLYANVNVEGELAKALPPKLQPLAGPASGGLRELALNISQRALAQPKVQALWEDANRTAHQEFLDVVDNKNEALSTTGGNVVLDLGTILNQVANQVGVGGNLASKLPPDAAQLTIMKSDQLEAVQTGVRILRTLAWLLAALAIVLFAAAIYLAGARRRETLRGVGIAFIAVGVAVLFTHGLAGNYVVGALTTTAASEPAANAAWSIGTSELVEIAQGLVLYGIVIVLAAWLAGPTAIGDLDPPRGHPLSPPAAVRLRGTRGAAGARLLVGTDRRDEASDPVRGPDRPHRAGRGDAAPTGDPRVPRPRHDGLRRGARPWDCGPDARGARASRGRQGRGCRAAAGRAARRPTRAARTAPRLGRPLGGRVRRGEAANPRGFLMDERTERVVVETDRHRIVGDITLPREGYRSRLSEYLNHGDIDFIPMADAELTPLHGGSPERRSFVAVGRSHVRLAFPYEGD